MAALQSDRYTEVSLYSQTHYLQALVCQKQLDHAARSADFSPDGSQVAVGLSNGEFIVFSATDLTLVGRKRDRNKTIQAIRWGREGRRGRGRGRERALTVDPPFLQV